MCLRGTAQKRLYREPLLTLGDQDVPSWTSLRTYVGLALGGSDKQRFALSVRTEEQPVRNTKGGY